jgi:hypothetical protein
MRLRGYEVSGLRGYEITRFSSYEIMMFRTRSWGIRFEAMKL